MIYANKSVFEGECSFYNVMGISILIKILVIRSCYFGCLQRLLVIWDEAF